MDPALKQRLVGAVVLVALAVIFLPMLIKGPAPESGVGEVSLELPPGPAGGFETRELPLVTPGATPGGGVVGMDLPGAAPADGSLPTVDAGRSAARDALDEPIVNEDAADLADAPAARPAPAATPPAPRDSTTRNDPIRSDMFPPPTAGGDWAVSFGTYSTTAAADRIVGDLRASQLPGFRERATVDGRTVYRVRIGPYASRADAEAARLRAAHVRDDVGAQVVALDAPAVAAGAGAATAPPAPAAPAAAADTGFVVQVGAFRDANEADALRDRVRAAGMGAFTEPVQTDQGRLTRVLVGPAFDRAEADRLKAQVKARFGIDGLVRSHP
jgi:cell division septation protein DedD